MNWHAAMGDLVFRKYVFIVLGLLMISGVLLALITWGLHKHVSKIWQIWRSWMVMAPLGLLMVALGRETTIAGVMLLAILGFKEFARATALCRNRGMMGVVYLAIVATGVVAWMGDPMAGGQRAGSWGLMQAIPVYAVAMIWLVPVVWNKVQGQLQAASLAILGFLCIGWMFSHLAFLVNSSHAYGYIAYIVFAVEVSDIAAFIFGKTLGRRTFRSNISPKKTWGGAIGALAVAMVLPWILGFSFPPAFDWRAKVAIGLIVGIGGQLGDLTISIIKRDLGIKDMGAAIPGHGGILDRIDSLIFVAPLFVRLVNFIEPMR